LQPKIVIAGYTHFSNLARRVIKEIDIPQWLEYEVTELAFRLMDPEIGRHIKSFIEPSTIVISGDRSAKVFKKVIKNLVIPVRITGFDVLEAVQKVGTEEVFVLNYQKNMKEISRISNLLKVRIRQICFGSKDEVYDILQKLRDRGVNDIIGGSWVCDVAFKMGLNGVSYYTYRSMANAFNDAVNILKAYRNELEQSVLFKSIMDMNRRGIISTDTKHCVNVISQSAERLLGIKKNQAIGESLYKIVPALTEQHSVSWKDQPQYNILFEQNQMKLVVDVAPVFLSGDIVGYILALDDVAHLQETERKIRKKTTQKTMIANYSFDDIIGSGRLIQETIHQAKKYSHSNSSILIYGESGTGKELFAQSIHIESSRSLYPFVAVNCAALPESLLDSELFGYEEGAFTGAKRGGKPGLFELAHQGTIFLDEISELPLHLQSRLLRVLQEREIMRIGGDQIIPIDVRIITASNSDLMECVRNGTFRKDLYFRISILQLYIPPLRRRIEDIPGLFRHFIKNETQLEDIVMDKQLEILLSHNWPGNVRELENVAERFVALSQGERLRPDSVLNMLQQALYPQCSLSFEEDIHQKLKFSESELVRQALAQAGGNKNKAASLLGISRTTLWRKMKEVGDYSLRNQS